VSWPSIWDAEFCNSRFFNFFHPDFWICVVGRPHPFPLPRPMTVIFRRELGILFDRKRALQLPFRRWSESFAHRSWGVYFF
jgi:hypothetical protein